MKIPYPTIRVPACHKDHLDKVCLGSAGPNPCVYGMRKMYWGMNATLIRCGQYVYRVTREVYEGYKLYQM